MSDTSTVRVYVAGGAHTVPVNGEAITVATVIDILDLDHETPFRRNGVTLSPDDTVTAGDVIVATPPAVKHGA